MKLGAIQWLILSAVVLVIAIMLGTGYFALQYRERALEVAERELSNSALLLSRHFDQQLNDLQHVHDDVVARLRADGVDTADAFERKMSTLSAHEMLRTKLAVLAACRRLQPLERQRLADQFFRDVAGAGRAVLPTGAITGVHLRAGRRPT